MTAGVGSMVSLLLVSAVSIAHDGQVGHQVVTERFQSRAALTASFVTGHVEDLAARERAQATRLLSDAEVSREVFEQVVLGFGFDAAVLLDSEGRALGVWPPTPGLIGAQLADRYAHLATALDGRTAVSGVTPSAASSVPVIAVAVPFDTSSGRRVFSGAFALDTVRLGISFSEVIPVAGRAYLIDDAGEIIMSGASDMTSESPRALTRAELLGLDQPSGSFARGGEWLTFVREPVAGTSWHVVLITPTARLFQAVDGSSHVSWTLFAAFAASGLVGLVLLSRLSRARAIAAATARLDALTQLPNRRAAEEHVHHTASTAARRSRAYGVLMIDIDRFKNINDTYGHQTGDDVLAQVARTLRRVARGEDRVSRWGGEEFLVVVSPASEDSIAVLAERFRSAVADMNIHVSATKSVTVTISVGGALGTDLAPTRALHAADSALYDAKLGGRNRVVMYRAGLVRPNRVSNVESVDRVTVGL
jgi:diguanylate cyclase (GGDEF)-like protein